jgi:hypothetical protein
VPVPPKKKKMKGMEECETLEKAFTILDAVSSGEVFGTFIANKFPNYLPRTRSEVQHEMINSIFAD